MYTKRPARLFVRGSGGHAVRLVALADRRRAERHGLLLEHRGDALLLLVAEALEELHLNERRERSSKKSQPSSSGKFSPRWTPVRPLPGPEGLPPRARAWSRRVCSLTASSVDVDDDDEERRRRR